MAPQSPTRLEFRIAIESRIAALKPAQREFDSLRLFLESLDADNRSKCGASASSPDAPRR
jgi:hypothetical protein